jgi:VanZ family protein
MNNTIAKSFILLSWAGAIFILIATPMREYYGTVVTYYDKAVHIFLFGIFSALVIYTLSDIRRLSLPVILAISFSVGIFYSAACEYIQAFVPGRDVSELDFAAGAFGCTLAQIYGFIRYRKR